MSHGRPHNRALLCHLTTDQYEYLMRFAEQHHVSMSVALVRLLKLARIVEQLATEQENAEQRP